MSQESVTRGGPADSAARWSAPVFQDALEVIAEGVTELVGFNLACISVVRQAPDGSQELEVIALAGHGFDSSVVGRRRPLAALLRELEKAEHWGRFRFLPHELLGAEDVENSYGWVVPDMVPLDGPDAWHPLDLLVALLHDDHGVLRGTLAIDVPVNGRRPQAEQRRLLEKFAVQAERAVVTTLEREELAAQVRLAETARQIVRNAGARRDLSDVLGDCQAGLVEGFRCHGSCIQTFDEDGRGTGAIHPLDGTPVELPEDLLDLVERVARACWAEQSTVMIARDHPVPAVVTAAEGESIAAFLESLGIGSLLCVPLGAGDECLGNLVLTRGESAEWTELDRQAALDIGHDLGRVILNSRTFQREHELVVELRALDHYKNQLIATVSHELKNPLTAVTGYLELLEAAPELSATSRNAVDAMGRGAARMSRVVEDLLLLSELGDPATRQARESVDLRHVVDEVVDLCALPAKHKGITLRAEVPDTPVTTPGDAAELDRVVINLVSNAVKYTPTGREVTIRLRPTGDTVALEVSDEGLGISPEDQGRLFDEFFRSSNPEAAEQPGTGLGLAIVKRIVERRGGEITVSSALGRGSTFIVVLPAAG